jgi:hypothetical protein
MTKSRKKDAYWHKITRQMIEYGLKPAQIGKVLKQVFPETEVNGRHIGAYKRRLTTEGVEIAVRPTMSMNEAMSIANELVNDEDKFIYNCSVGSIKRSLKCFEYKMTREAEEVDTQEEIDIWVSGLKQA